MADPFREVLGEVRYRLSVDLKARYPETYGERGFMQTTEAYFVRAMYGVDLQGRTAAYYIAPGDGGGPIIVEIATELDDKWQDLRSTDGRPVRVLRVNLDGIAQLSNARHTQFETDLMSVLEPGSQAQPQK
jgi:hypothetical protein